MCRMGPKPARVRSALGDQGKASLPLKSPEEVAHLAADIALIDIADGRLEYDQALEAALAAFAANLDEDQLALQSRLYSSYSSNATLI